MTKVIPKGVRVSFTDSIVYESDGYIIPKCSVPCKWGHDDCYEEDYLAVTQHTGRAIPVSKLQTVFDRPDGYGRPATNEEKGVESGL